MNGSELNDGDFEGLALLDEDELLALRRRCTTLVQLQRIDQFLYADDRESVEGLLYWFIKEKMTFDDRVKVSRADFYPEFRHWCPSLPITSLARSPTAIGRALSFLYGSRGIITLSPHWIVGLRFKHREPVVLTKVHSLSSSLLLDVKQFIKDDCEYTPDHMLATQTFREEFYAWRQHKGRTDRAPTITQIGLALATIQRESGLIAVDKNELRYNKERYVAGLSIKHLKRTPIPRSWGDKPLVKSMRIRQRDAKKFVE